MLAGLVVEGFDFGRRQGAVVDPDFVDGVIK
jgi:hypothetical protein